MEKKHKNKKCDSFTLLMPMFVSLFVFGQCSFDTSAAEKVKLTCLRKEKEGKKSKEGMNERRNEREKRKERKGRKARRKERTRERK